MADNPSLFEEKPTTLVLLEGRASDLLDKFGAGGASPGSGSAAALMGLLAIKLMQTVCLHSQSKVPSKKSTFEFINEQSSITEPQLKSLFEDDAKIFQEVVDLRKLRDLSTNSREKGILSRDSN